MRKFFSVLGRIKPFWRRKDAVALPGTKPRTRTGELRYAGYSWVEKDGLNNPVRIHRLDRVSLHDLKRHRHYPPVRDGINARVGPISRVNFRFESDDPNLAALAQQILEQPVRRLLSQLAKNSFTFGFQVVEVRWTLAENVRVSSGQSSQTDVSEVWPFAWTVDHFAELDPTDVHLFVDPATGKFAGAMQLMGNGQMVPAGSLILHTYNREFDLLYGVSGIMHLVPFISGAEDLFDSMLAHGRRFGSPWTVVKYPTQLIPTGAADAYGNPIGQSADLIAMSVAEGLDAGGKAAIPSTTGPNGEPHWSIDIVEPGVGSDLFIDRLNWIDKVIRLGLSVPEMASSSTPNNGTYNLGESILDLYLANIETDIDNLAATINEQFMDRWSDLNAGRNGARCRIATEPVGPSIKKALLQGLLQKINEDFPITDAEGNEYQPDWAKVAGDNGLPLLKKNLDTLRESLQRRLATPSDDDTSDIVENSSTL